MVIKKCENCGLYVIPYSRKDDFIDIYCKDFIDQIDHPISMIKISSVLCFGIVMNSLEAAEKLCKALNGKDGMKAHLHNKTCKKGNRKSNKTSRRIYP